MTECIWECKVVIEIDGDLPRAADWPMRQAVDKAIQNLVGVEYKAMFSGWGGKLTDIERDVMDNKV